MNKKNIIDKIATEIGYTKKDVASVVDKVFDTIITAVANGQEVAVAGFGKFYAKEQGERTCRNPKDGTTIQVPAKTVPKFKFGKAFKDAVAGA